MLRDANAFLPSWHTKQNCFRRWQSAQWGLAREECAAPEKITLFDANRVGSERQILKPELFAERDRLLAGPVLPFDLEIVTNEKDDEFPVSSWVRAAGGTEVKHVPTNLRWPGDLFALSHVAVPVPADDPVYGEVRPAKSNGRIWLGHAAL